MFEIVIVRCGLTAPARLSHGYLHGSEAVDIVYEISNDLAGAGRRAGSGCSRAKGNGGSG